MSEVEEKVVASYASVLRNLSTEAKQQLISVLTQSLADSADDQNLQEDFGGYIPEKTAEEIIADLRAARHFCEKDLSF